MDRILIVEDDLIISENIKKHLDSWGYEAESIRDFKNILEEVESFSPHLVLMDIILPYFDGYHWCREIRKVSSVPIMFISSVSDNMNIIMAMSMGGDDFIAKPFDLNVLTSKVQALLRRVYGYGAAQNTLEHNGVTLDINRMLIEYNNVQVELTKNEFKITQLLLENHGRVVSREMIMTKLWETDSFIDDNTLTVNVARLRKKLEEIDLKDFITTKKGIGYIIS